LLRDAREAELGDAAAEVLDLVAVVHHAGLGLDSGRQARDLLQGGVDPALEELAVVEDRLQAVGLVHREDHLGVVAAVAREEDAAVDDEAVAREGVLPARGGVGNVLGAEEGDLDAAQGGDGELAVGPAHALGVDRLPEVAEREGLPAVDLVVGGPAAQGHGPEELLELPGDDDLRLLAGRVAVQEHHLLQAADVVGVAVGDEEGADVRHGEAERGQGLGGAGAAVDEEVVLALGYEEVVLVEFLREGAARAYEGQGQLARRAELEAGCGGRARRGGAGRAFRVHLLKCIGWKLRFPKKIRQMGPWSPSFQVFV